MRRRWTPLLILALAGAAGAAPVAPQSAPQPDVAAQVRDRVRSRDDDLAAAARARVEIAGLTRELVMLGRAQALGENDVSGKRLRLQALSLRDQAVSEKLGRNRAQLARLLSALQMMRRDPPPALLVSPGDAKDAVRAAILIHALTPALAERARALSEEAEDAARLRRAAASASEDLFTAESALNERRAQIEGLIAEKAELERRAMQEAAVADREARALAARARTVAGAVDALRDMPGGPIPSRGSMIAPVQGEPVAAFGGRLSTGARSEGMAVRTLPAAVVRAPAAGEVDFAGPLQGWGLVLILRTGGGYHLVLGGLGETSAVPGQSVAAGEPIGRMVGVGQSPPDLYFEIRKDGTPLDPAPWLRPADRRLSTGQAAPG